MTPEQLHRAVLTATAFGDDARYAQLRRKFGPYDAGNEFEHLEGAAAACLAHRLGEVDTTGKAGAGSTAGGRAELARFIAELGAAGPEYRPAHGPPSNFLEVEAVIRGLRGERHLMAELGGDRMRCVFRFLVRYLTATVPEIREDFDSVVDKAREHVMRGLMG